MQGGGVEQHRHKGTSKNTSKSTSKGSGKGKGDGKGKGKGDGKSRWDKAVKTLDRSGTGLTVMMVVLTSQPQLDGELGRHVRIALEAVATLILGPLDGRQQTGIFGSPHT